MLKRSKEKTAVSRWPTRRTLDRLGEGAGASFGTVTRLIEDRAVSVPNENSNELGWGQYLDEDHKSTRQWGRYGTSAAVRALACAQRAIEPNDSVMNRASILQMHPQLLPDQVPAPDPALKTDDFDRVIKLSYIIEGVRPQETRIPEGAEPPIVEHLRGLRHGGQKGWSSRDGRDSYRDRRLSTAVALHALRRFPGAQKDEHVREAYQWLAKEAQKDGVQVDLSALIGIALVEASPPIREQREVREALTALDQRLTSWSKRQKRLAIDRPYFNGFVEHDLETQRDSTDYVFLSPELLAVRYFLKRDLPQARRFVLRVVCALIENIKANTANEMGGYKIQETMIRTVDQAWAMDLLETFEAFRKETPRQLLPSNTSWLTSFGVLMTGWFVLLAAMTIGLVATQQPIFPIIGILVGVLFTLALRARKSPT